MKINKKSLFTIGILVFFSFSIISPVFCKATAAHDVIWDLEQDNYLLKNFYVDEDDNFYFSYKNTDENQFYFTKISDEGVNYYTKNLDSEPSFYSYFVDDSISYFFVSIDKQIFPGDNVLGREFTIVKYTNELILDSIFHINLSSYFEGNLVGNLRYVDSDCVYIDIREYQTELTDLDSLQLAKFNTQGERLWNRTIALNPDRKFFSFCKNNLENVYVEHEGVLYYFNGEDGSELWKKEIILDDPGLIAFEENVLMVKYTQDGNLALYLVNVNQNIEWEYIIQKTMTDSYFEIQNVYIKDLSIGVSLKELKFDSAKETMTNIFHLKILNATKDVLYEEKIERMDNVETHADIFRNIKIYPTSDGNFYLYELMKDRVNDFAKNTIQYCIPRANFSSGFTIFASLTSVSILVLLVIYRRRTSK